MRLPSPSSFLSIRVPGMVFDACFTFSFPLLQSILHTAVSVKSNHTNQIMLVPFIKPPVALYYLEIKFRRFPQCFSQYSWIPWLTISLPLQFSSSNSKHLWTWVLIKQTNAESAFMLFIFWEIFSPRGGKGYFFFSIIYQWLISLTLLEFFIVRKLGWHCLFLCWGSQCIHIKFLTRLQT